MKKLITTLLILASLTSNANAQIAEDIKGENITPIKVEIQSNKNSDINHILKLAKYHADINTPYVFGAVSEGDNPKSFDCSSFVQWLYKQIDINLPRVSYEQAKCGTKVNINDIQPGDIICFITDNRNNGNVTHVGIYLGDGLFVHARNSRLDTRIDKYEGYWKAKTATIRRIVK